ncbi:retinoic acid-induced protein 1 isoform X3 [Pungitius pungitius]|uniref:retinoic acid-induced protein 1 isoform X3 n=1 Tax=Pungitius pungitius TaxID=134920 RepID=UPI002E0EBE3B
MEQRPMSLGHLQPQDLSTSSIPNVIDLTRKGEECVLNSPSLDPLSMVKNPCWYPNSVHSNPKLPFLLSRSSETTLQSGDPIQPDDAFSHTTVTLSYMSRSCVFSSHGVPPIGKLTLHSPCGLDKGRKESGYALNQHYLEPADGSMDLATQTDFFQSLTPAQVGAENHGGVCLMQESQKFKGGLYCKEINTPRNGKEYHGLPLDRIAGLENERDDNGTSSGACADSSIEKLTSVAGEDQGRGTSEALSVNSNKQNPRVLLDNVSDRDVCLPSRDYISPLEDPVSPSATSLDNVEDLFVLPQASSSPSGDNSYLETLNEVTGDGLRTERAIQKGSGISDTTSRLEASAENKQPVSRLKAVLEPLIVSTDDVCVSNVSKNKPKTVTSHMNGNAKAVQGMLIEKKRPGRGTRLDAIIMNINSRQYKVSGCIRTNKKAKTSQLTGGDPKLATSERNATLSAEKRRNRGKAPFSVKTMKQTAVTSTKRIRTNMNTDICKINTDSQCNYSTKSNGNISPKSSIFSVHKKSKRGPEDVPNPAHEEQTSPVGLKRKPPSPQFDVHNNSKEPEHICHPEPLMEIHIARLAPRPSPKKSQGQTTSSKQFPTVKAKADGIHKKRKKKCTWSQYSSIFSRKEPEIKLKYINFREEKKDYRLDSLTPFVHVEGWQSASSLCTIINYPEEVSAQHKRGQQQQAHHFGLISAVVPSTSSLQLGRPSTLSRQQRALVCCLCEQAANAMDLGDLHGPYYPEGYQRITKRLGLKVDRDDYSDTDSSSYSVRGKRRKCAISLTPGTLGLSQPKQKGLDSYQGTANKTASTEAKQTRSDGGRTDVEDWYSPPVLPQQPCEYWLHEDCAIWTAGVFLVKGKVYGLEEAVKAAQETRCSACSLHGATLGCFFKGCANKYHYRCALESADCVLIEDNFSMKCKKHKDIQNPSREPMRGQVTQQKPHQTFTHNTR